MTRSLFRVIVLIGALPAALAAQDASARGRVVDRRSLGGLESAELRVDGAARATRTAADGSWSLTGLPAGMHTLRVRRMGYESATLQLRLAAGGDTALVVALMPAARPLDAIVVTAARREQRLKDVVATTELVQRSDIAATGASDVSAVLAEQTGIQFTGGHPSGSGVALEGLSDQRVLVLVDGLPLYGRIAGGFDLSRIPTSAVERIEVVKGPQSTLYGSEAMGGVVNIITRNAALSSVPADVELRTVVGSDRRSDTDLLATLRRGSLAMTANVGHRYAERTPGIVGATGAMTDRVDGLATLRWTPAASPLAVEASALVLSERQRWLSGGLYDFADNTQRNARLGATWTTPAQKLTGTLAFSGLDHLSRASQYTSPIQGTGTRQDQRLAQAEGIYSRTLGSMVLDAGTLLRRESIMSTDGRVSGGSRALTSVEPYAQAEFTRGALSIVPGARLSWNEQWGTYTSPRVALRYHADSSLTLRASVGRGFRAPDFKELYLDFTNNAGFYSVVGNANLRPEHSDNASLGLEYTGDRLSGRAHAYWNELYDFIETRPLASSDGYSRYTYGNVDRAMTRGVELESGVTFGALRTSAGYAHLTTLDRTVGGPLLGQAANSGRVLLSGPVAGGVLATATGVYTGRAPMARDSVGAVSDWRDAYARLDLRAARRVGSRANLSLGVDNVFDARPARWADVTTRQVYLAIAWQLRAPEE